MIMSGFIGAVVSGGTDDPQAMIIWGSISAVFWLVTTVVLIEAVRQSLPKLSLNSATLLRNASILLLTGWMIYPITYLVHIFTGGGGWATFIQITLCLADLGLKSGLGDLIHRVAKLHTAEDVRRGIDVHGESIWVSAVKHSDAGIARSVYLAGDASGQVRRQRPPTSTAVAALRD